MRERDKNMTDWGLIASYVSGNASEPEVKKILAWMQESEGNANIVKKAEDIWLASKNAKAAGIDVNKAWNNVDSKVNVYGKTIRWTNLRTSTKYILRIAAVLVIGLISYFTIDSFSGEKSVDSGSSIKQLALSDGSIVDMYKNSQLSFPEKFKGNTREVTLKGEAFFRIKKNVEKPFIIHTSKADIKVLGTSFSVNSHPNGDLEVIVNTGVVSVTSENNGNVILHKNEKATYQVISSSLIKSVNTDENFISWKTHNFVFREAVLEEVFSKLEKAYDISIDVKDTSVLKCKLTATYNNLDVKEVIEMIDMTFGFSTKAVNNTYTIEGSSCLKKH